MHRMPVADRPCPADSILDKWNLTSTLEQTMSRGPYPIMLMLAMSLPSAARALGLGDIRIDSALNEPLSAQIDIVGATRDELAALTAKVASREVFQRYGADRPSFLSSATFKVGLDAQGRPVLNIRSNEAFTDPLVSFLVDLRWGNGELVREYSLLLDPAGYSPSTQVPGVAVAATPTPAPAPTAALAPAPAPAPKAESTPTPPAVDPNPSGEPARHLVGPRDTLRAIARRAGARTELLVQRTMIAIFRANPKAFDGNINRMHAGVVLTLPTAAEVQAISAAEAKREVREHMTAWRLDGRPAAARRVAATTAPAATPTLVPTPTPAAPAPASSAGAQPAKVAKEDPNDSAIKDRLQALEQELDEVHKQLASEHTKIQALKHAGERAAAEAAEQQDLPSSSTVEAAEVTPPVSASPAPPRWMSGKSLIGALTFGMGLVVAGFVYLRRRRPAPIEPHPYDVIAAEEHLAKLSNSAALDAAPAASAAMPPPVSRPASPRPEPATHASIVVTETPAPVSHTETTVSLAVDAEALERSYLDTMAIDSLGIDTSILDSVAQVDTTAHDASTAHDVSAAHDDSEAQADTAVVDHSTLDTAEHEVCGLDTIAVDPSELDTAIRQEALNTAVLDVKAFNGGALSKTVLDYNLLDLDATGQHVDMPSKLHDRVEVSERRTNIADVLKAAIERDPFRRDLRMKLLESYYSAASMNQRAFMEIVRKAARERDYLSSEDWSKVKAMGRDIAGGDPLFNDDAKQGDLADCA